jgi:hypothetical protein
MAITDDLQLPTGMGTNFLLPNDLHFKLAPHSYFLSVAAAAAAHAYAHAWLFVTRDDYLQADKKLEIEIFNEQLAASLNEANFIIHGEGEFNSLYLQDIDDDLHSGI